MNSQRVPPCSAREPRSDAISVASDRGNVNNLIANPRLIDAERSDPFRDDLTDQPRLVFIGRRFAVPFLFVPFHSLGGSRVCQK